jgi:hypothetical protein
MENEIETVKEEDGLENVLSFYEGEISAEERLIHSPQQSVQME